MLGDGWAASHPYKARGWACVLIVRALKDRLKGSRLSLTKALVVLMILSISVEEYLAPLVAMLAPRSLVLLTTSIAEFRKGHLILLYQRLA